MAIEKNAQMAIHTASVAAAGVSASPIPFSDSALLVPIQTTMIMAIYKAYDREVSEGLIKGAVKAITVSAIGKGVAGNLIKMIPFFGTITGGIINAGVAVGFTEAIGFGVANAFENESDDKSIDILEVLYKILFDYKKKSI